MRCQQRPFLFGCQSHLPDCIVYSTDSVNPTALSLKAGCELFLRYTTRTSALELSEFGMAKAHLIEVCTRRG